MKRLLAAALLLALPLAAQEPGAAYRLDTVAVRADGQAGGVNYGTMPAPPGCASGYVPYFDASLKLQCSPTVWAPSTATLTVPGTVAAKNLTVSGLATPGGITVTPTLTQVATITTVAGSALVDGDYFTIKYDGGVVPIEFDLSPGDGTSGGRIPLLFTAGDSADTVRDNVILTLNAAAPTKLTASSGGAATVALVLDTPGADASATPNTENVAAGGFAVTGFSNPTAATTYTYKLVARLSDGSTTEAGAASTTAAGHATLSAANYNALSWSAVTGAASYDVYRTVGGATQGKILSAAAVTALNDTGLAGGGETAPTIDTTGLVSTDHLTSGRILVGDGTAGAPGYSFASDPRDGMFRDANGVRISFQSSLKILFGASAVTLVAPIDFGGYGSYLSSNEAGVVSVGAAATEGSKTGSLKATSYLPPANGTGDVGSASLGMKRIYVDYTNTATIGAVTINKAAGRVNIDTGGTSVVVTNSLVTAASHVFAVVSTPDAAAYVKHVVPASGSFTITLGAAAGAQTSIDFLVVSSD